MGRRGYRVRASAASATASASVQVSTTSRLRGRGRRIFFSDPIFSRCSTRIEPASSRMQTWESFAQKDRKMFHGQLPSQAPRARRSRERRTCHPARDRSWPLHHICYGVLARRTVELTVAGQGGAVQVELELRNSEALALARGDPVHLSPRRVRVVFPADEPHGRRALTRASPIPERYL